MSFLGDMNSIKLEKRLKRYKVVEKTAVAIRTMKRNTADKEYNKATQTGHKFKDDLKKYFEKLVWEKVQSDAPCNRDGHPIYFDELYLYTNKVSIRWDADHPNDIIDVDFTFDELLKQKQSV